MRGLYEIMFDFGTHVYLCDDDDDSTDEMRLAFYAGKVMASFDMNADELQQLADAMYEIRRQMFDRQLIRCPRCRCTWPEAIANGDHRHCIRYPFFPDENGNSYSYGENDD